MSQPVPIMVGDQLRLFDPGLTTEAVREILGEQRLRGDRDGLFTEPAPEPAP